MKIAPGPYLIGQAVDVEVMVDPAIGEESGGRVEPPRIPQADLIAVDVARSGSKPEVLARFYLVPRRSGRLAIPPFRVYRGERVLVSKPSPITVANLPLSGRTPAFLGGVGGFRVACKVEPKSVRVGEPVEVEIRMTGPGAVGSQLAPDVSPWLKQAPGFQIRDSTSQLDRNAPPTRTFRYRLRPTKPGQAVLPPIALSAFDPRSRGYTTQYTPSLSVTVESPPPFDPAQVNFGPILSSEANGRGRVAFGLAMTVGVAMLVFPWFGWPIVRSLIERYRADRPVDWRREASGLPPSILSEGDRIEVAQRVADRFARAVAAATRKPVAVLTPRDASEAVLAITNDPELSKQAGRLVATLDQVRFDPEVEATVGDLEFVAEAAAVFQAIGRRAERKGSDRRWRSVEPEGD